MKSISTKLLAFLLVPSMLLLAGCSDDGDPIVDPPDEGPEIPRTLTKTFPVSPSPKTRTWSSDTTITGPRYALPGVALTVEEGVTVTFTYHNNVNADVGTIITLPGDDENFAEDRPSGRLVAEGTANNPIVFTSDRKQVASWGGIILAGEASNNVPGGVGEIEGLVRVCSTAST
ncbi:MAG: hypothetical protein U5K31_12530 [Balneolaceae bacterium]|nr:hypothetical protein [Balneolaceae bacterium]